MRQLILLVLLLVAATTQLRAQAGVTSATWQQQPAIREIRVLAREVDQQLARRELIERVDSAECDDGRIRLVARLFTDSSGVVRKYVIEGGSDDSAGEARYYYDQRGTLRFVFARTNAVNGTRRDDRTYYGADGTELRKDTRLRTGPGYPGGFGHPVRDPAADFRSLCGSAN